MTESPETIAKILKTEERGVLLLFGEGSQLLELRPFTAKNLETFELISWVPSVTGNNHLYQLTELGERVREYFLANRRTPSPPTGGPTDGGGGG